MSLTALLGVVKDLSVLTALIIALWGGSTRRWVWGHHYQEALTREQWWKDYALSLQDVTEKALGLAGRRRT